MGPTSKWQQSELHQRSDEAYLGNWWRHKVNGELSRYWFWSGTEEPTWKPGGELFGYSSGPLPNGNVYHPSGTYVIATLEEEPAVTTGFVTKDSGARTQFASGMQRDVSTDKPMPHLAYDGPLFDRWVGLLTRGAKKYEPRNWMKASGQAELDRFIESAVRHFHQWLRGDTDEDHAAAVVFNLNGAEYVKDKLAEAGDEGSEF